jgi:hypothetical protein
VEKEHLYALVEPETSLLGVYPVTLTDRRMDAYIDFDAMSGRILTNDYLNKPPAGSSVYSLIDPTMVVAEFFALTMRNPWEVVCCKK